MITKQHTADLKDMVDILSDINKELDGSMHTCKLCGRDSWVDLQEGRLANEVAIMLTIAIGYVLAVVTMVVMQDVSDYVRSKRGKLND